MSMEVTGIPRNIETLHAPLGFPASLHAPAEENGNIPGKEDPKAPSKLTYPMVEQQLKELEGLTRFLNRKLKFSFNEELQQVVVKIVEGDTDKVIKVLPPEELQKLRIRIREIIGILFDQRI